MVKKIGKITEREFLVGVKILNRIELLESQVKELQIKHKFMEQAIEKKAGMLEPIRKEDWRFRK
jgi:hypothetical protein